MQLIEIIASGSTTDEEKMEMGMGSTNMKKCSNILMRCFSLW